ncbi:GGDEF domain-containing protein [Marinomonas sp. C2222]|uniref:diguanylate cyclase n=1 Tax=Marinomonas sargassi TaxID=2984494 RepID=A0ABT2YRS1_9GAMM|nr:GGDEF domain-containing protein [Marinomonas sargassi]MCV2402589.1 GGDEF domain-containing protein [Marinomonas sargassi]
MSQLELDTYKQLVETTPVLFYVVDVNLNYTYISPFFARIHNITQEEAVGLCISDVIGEEGFKGNFPHYQAVLNGESIAYDSFFIKPDGNPHYYHAIYTPLEDSGEIIGFTGVVIDTTAEKTLDRLAKTDELTSLKNRREFEAYLESLLKSDDAQNHTLLLVDIDHFKSINDDLGHGEGDKVLVKFARILEGTIASAGDVYRVGGEEFMVILPHMSDDTLIKEKSNELRSKIESAKLTATRRVTASIGGTTFNHKSVRSDLLRKVDGALYTSKENGRNCVTIL